VPEASGVPLAGTEGSNSLSSAGESVANLTAFLPLQIRHCGVRRHGVVGGLFFGPKQTRSAGRRSRPPNSAMLSRDGSNRRARVSSGRTGAMAAKGFRRSNWLPGRPWAGRQGECRARPAGAPRERAQLKSRLRSSWHAASPYFRIRRMYRGSTVSAVLARRNDPLLHGHRQICRLRTPIHQGPHPAAARRSGFSDAQPAEPSSGIRRCSEGRRALGATGGPRAKYIARVPLVEEAKRLVNDRLETRRTQKRALSKLVMLSLEITLPA
jgi:hypothetical protein